MSGEEQQAPTDRATPPIAPLPALDAATSAAISALVAEQLKVALQALQPNAGAVSTDPIQDAPASVTFPEDTDPNPAVGDRTEGTGLPDVAVAEPQVPAPSPHLGDEPGEDPEESEYKEEFQFDPDGEGAKAFTDAWYAERRGTSSVFASRSPAVSKADFLCASIRIRSSTTAPSGGSRQVRVEQTRPVHSTSPPLTSVKYLTSSRRLLALSRPSSLASSPRPLGKNSARPPTGSPTYSSAPLGCTRSTPRSTRYCAVGRGQPGLRTRS